MTLKVSCPWVSELKPQNQSQRQQGSLFSFHSYPAALKHSPCRRQSSHWTWVLTRVHRPIPKYKISENKLPPLLCKSVKQQPSAQEHLKSPDYTVHYLPTNIPKTLAEPTVFKQSGGDSSGWSPWANYGQGCNHVCPRLTLWLGKNKELQSLTWTCPGSRNCCPVWTPSSSLDPQEQSVPKWVKKSRTVHLNPSSCMDWFYSTQEGHTARSSSIPERLCISPGLSKPDWACYNHQWNLCGQCRICTSMYHD